MVNVEFHFDFGSPNAFLSHRVIPMIEQRTDATFRYVPVLLGGVFKATGNRSPMEAFGGIKNKLEYAARETTRFLHRHGITNYQRNPFFPVNTLLIMRAAVAAEQDGALMPYVSAVFHHMWEAPKNMADRAVVLAALDSSGLDGAALLARADDPVVKRKLIENTDLSVARGAFGSPTFFVNNEMWFGKDKLAEVEEAIKAG